MVLSTTGFKLLCQQNAVEAVFVRRHDKPGWQPHRRIFCTLDRNLLSSIAGRISLKFRPPVHPPPYVASKYQLVVVWDLFWQDWRAVPVNTLEIVSVIPTHTKKHQDEFWSYFSDFLYNLTPAQKEAFMNR